MRKADPFDPARIRLAFGQAEGFVVYRNQTGFYEIDGRAIKYGLCVGGSDIIGIAPGGLFFASECKRGTGRLSDEQRRFLQLVYDSGGVACETRSVEQAEEQIRGIRAGIRRHF